MIHDHPFLGPIEWEHGDGNSIILPEAWKAANIHTVHVPQLAGLMTDDGPTTGNVLWNVKGTDAFLAAFQEVEDRNLKSVLLTFDGTAAFRTIRGYPDVPSNHAFATAIDLNAGWNGLGNTPPPAGERGSLRYIVPIFNRWGFMWGGDYRHRKDGMHLEQLREPVEGQAPVSPAVTWQGNEVPIPCLLLRDGEEWHAWIGIRAYIAAVGGQIIAVSAHPFIVTAKTATGDERSLEARNIHGVGYVRFTDTVPGSGLTYAWDGAHRVLAIRRAV